MTYDLHSELTTLAGVISRLENALADADSEHERDKEALERKHRNRKEGLNSSLASLKSARAALLRGDQSGHGSEEPPKTTNSGSSEEAEHNALSNGHGDVELIHKPEKKFSIRHEIENLFPELDPSRDVLQGEITHTLRERFPQHKDSIKAATVSSALRRIANAGGLVHISKGKGSEPNRYRLPGSESSKESQEELSELKE